MKDYHNMCFFGERTKHAISRATYNKLKKGDIIQFGIGARVGGYSPCRSRVVSLGKISSEKKKIAQVCLDAYNKVVEWLKEGVMAKEVAKKYYDYVEKRGFKDSLLYGPCHGTGMLGK